MSLKCLGCSLVERGLVDVQYHSKHNFIDALTAVEQLKSVFDEIIEALETGEFDTEEKRMALLLKLTLPYL